MAPDPDPSRPDPTGSDADQSSARSKKVRERDARPIVWMIAFLVIAMCVYFVLLGQRGVD